MTTTFHLLTGEFPPQRGGVGDYTSLLASSLASRGCQVHVWCPSLSSSERSDVLHLHPLPDTFGPLSRRMLEAAFVTTPGCVLLQYVPNILGARGANLPFCVWLRGLRRRDVDVRVMFHEPYFYFAWQHPLRNVLAATQRLMAAVLLQAGRVVYLSTETWVRYLSPFAPRAVEMIVMPIPSTIRAASDPAAVSRWRAGFGAAPIAGHFGTFGDHLAAELRKVIPALLRADPRIRFVCIGQGSEAFASGMRASHADLAERITATGALSTADVAAAVRACDVMVQPYPDGVTTRRTSVMALLANQVATVTTDGFLTEPVWRTSGAVALGAAGDPQDIAQHAIALLADRHTRSALADAGLRAYERHFAIDRTVERLVSPVSAS